MADLVEEILKDFRIAIDEATANAMKRFQFLASAAAADALSREHASSDVRLISVGAAGHHADLTDDRIRQLCREHPYGSSPGGFGYKRGGRWQVVDHNFRQYLAGVRPGTDGARDAEHIAESP